MCVSFVVSARHYCCTVLQKHGIKSTAVSNVKDDYYPGVCTFVCTAVTVHCVTIVPGYVFYCIITCKGSYL